MSTYDDIISEIKVKPWQQALYDKYPKLFRQKDLPASETCMCWGISCGEGWKDIIDNACQKLQKYADEKGIIIEFAQVKEKFAGLRLYTEIIYPDGHKLKEIVVDIVGVGSFKNEREAIWRDIHNITGEAEELSLKTCDVCGKPGKPRQGGWIVTRCDEHAKGNAI
jgi:hypothetical protein